MRLDTALDVDYTMHRLLPSWTKATSPSGINNVYTFTPGSPNQDAQTARSGQSAFADFGLHPIETISGDIGAEFIGNYDQTFWHPVSDENRMYVNDQHAKIVRSDIKYDDGDFLLRGFQAVAMPDWSSKNDLFVLYPGQLDTEYPRRSTAGGPLVPRGGQMRYKSDNAGTLEVIGGAETVWHYGPGVYAKYDAPAIGNWEQSLVYRNENITWNQLSPSDPNERRWALSYNNSYHNSERMDTHWGLLYQPYRLNDTYADANDLLADGTYRVRSMRQIDALGLTLRTEMKPTAVVDQVDVGLFISQDSPQATKAAGGCGCAPYLPYGLDGFRSVYLSPSVGRTCALYVRRNSGSRNPGAVLSTPRGPDDAFPRGLEQPRGPHSQSHDGV